uniref:Glycosyltransferase family 92 protein n=1 Tax=Acrobeloides nanus TaxID=290746 RepID=A0A914E7G2_9BILA
MIADWDDVLVPKHHRNYFDELIWLNQLYPSAAAFVFSRPHSTLYTASIPEKFNLASTIETAQISWHHLNTGKFVGLPSKFNGTWIHAPTRVKPGHDKMGLL